MNDLELLEKYVDTCLGFIDPFTFREIERRGLTRFVNYLPSNKEEAKGILYARLAKEGKVFGDEEIDYIASEIKRVEDLLKKLNSMNMADAHKVLPILEEMKITSNFILNYYK